MNMQTKIPKEIKEFINSQKWIFAKT